MNLAITIFGFVLSALFLMVICCRLLCSRSRQNGHPLDMFQSDSRSMVERSINGLEPSVVTCFPTIKYNQHIFTSSEDNMCTICLSDYKEKEILRILPRCGHAFHISCIDLWLRQHHTCPVCRISLQVFSEWSHMAGPLISLVAKVRFVPGALPDHLFEQPRNYLSVPTGMPIGISKNNPAWTVVAGESSNSSPQDSQALPGNELQPGDRQQLLEHRVTVVSDDACHQEGSGLSPGSHDVYHHGSVHNTSNDGIVSKAGVSSMNVAATGAQSGA
ncbi:hypothetical protein GOP47_0001950 [Adiantum capillus-veneris]|uniref:RING-type E3 ubiquitin transferase n=1 Tax=Adiantum capillus-veneris TaxID=13818 RepID=A0A9D4ZQM7_ADICA|nr:hypothetical protein GOP47_0001950 [Adiantum capillus-veneris]